MTPEDCQAIEALMAQWRAVARKMRIPFPGLSKNEPTASCLERSANELESLLALLLVEAPQRQGKDLCHHENYADDSVATTGGTSASTLNAEPAEPLSDGGLVEAALGGRSTNLSVKTNATDETGKHLATCNTEAALPETPVKGE